MATARGERRRAREMAFRVLYEGGVTGDRPSALLESDEEAGREPGAREYASDLLDLVDSRGAEIDAALARHSRNWSLERLAATDRAVLRLAAAELLFRPDVPGRVVIDEAIEISRRFGNASSSAFVNGVLDAVWRETDPRSAGEAPPR